MFKSYLYIHPLAYVKEDIKKIVSGKRLLTQVPYFVSKMAHDINVLSVLRLKYCKSRNLS